MSLRRFAFACLLAFCIPAFMEAQDTAASSQLDARRVTRPRLAQGNGIWIKPRSTPLPGNEAVMVARLKDHSIKHVFLWTVHYNAARYAVFAPFIREAHRYGLTVHAVCATRETTVSQGVLSPALLTTAIREIAAYNTSHPEASLDGAQIDIEGVEGPELLKLLTAVHVPATLVFSAAIQPEEFHDNMEPSFAALLEKTDLSVLVPMLYTMDDIAYKGGTARFPLDIARLRARTTRLLSEIPSKGSLMIGLSAYDREFPVLKSTGGVDREYLNRLGTPDGLSQIASSPDSSYGVAHLTSAGKLLMSVSRQTNAGVNVYRFDYDTNHWVDVIETTPLGLRDAIAAADKGAAGDSRYVGACVWLYQTTFDPYSRRQEGLGSSILQAAPNSALR